MWWLLLASSCGHAIEIVLRLHKLCFSLITTSWLAEVKEQAQMLGEWKIVMVNREYNVLTPLQIVSIFRRFTNCKYFLGVLEIYSFYYISKHNKYIDVQKKLCI
jgi:hypothetical protein